MLNSGDKANSSLQMPGSTSQYFAGIQDELSTLMLEKKAGNEQVFEWINVSVLYKFTISLKNIIQLVLKRIV